MSASRLSLWIAVGLIVLFLVLPVLIVIPVSFADAASFRFPPEAWSMHRFAALFASEEWRGAFFNSLTLAVIAGFLSTVIGWFAALGLIRWQATSRRIVEGFLTLPIVVPGIVGGIAIFALFLQLKLVGTFTGFLLAHICLTMPFTLITMRTALKNYDETHDRAAEILGANAVKVFRHVKLPLLKAPLLTSYLLSFVISFDEVIVGHFISTPQFTTFPVVMFQKAQEELDPSIATASTVMLVLTSCILALVAVFGRQSRKETLS